MRKLPVNTFVSLDCVMQAPGGPEEKPSGALTHGGWSVNYWDDTMMAAMGDYTGKPFELLLGGKTYEVFAASWPHVSDDPAPDVLNAAPKRVVSRTLDKTEWQNSTLSRATLRDTSASSKNRRGRRSRCTAAAT